MNNSFKVRKGIIRAIAIAMVSAVSVFMLTACDKNGNGDGPDTHADDINIVCTTFPQYDWVKNVVGDADRVNITLLEDKGVDLHSYQPTADDMVKIKESDMFIYVGGESDEWVEDALEDVENKKLVAINLMQVLGNKVKAEEMKEGMQAEEHDHDADEGEHDHDADEHEHEEGEVEMDEHVWLSLKNAAVITQEIADKLAKMDKNQGKTFEANAKAYIEKLNKLDGEYAQAVSEAPKKTLLFGDRFPFRYLVDDYNLDYYAAFVGCSAETEASFETVAFLSKKVDDLGLENVVTIDKSDKEIAKTIIANSKDKSAKIITLNSLQTVDAKQIKDGVTYLDVMEDNLKVLKEALR